jgi:uncharacterized SAM-binding protein YcdF (DUF218 family)
VILVNLQAPLRRAALAMAGVLLVLNALYLFTRGVIHVGSLAPALLGVFALGLAWRWPAVMHWRTTQRWHEWLWRGTWLGIVLWLLSLAVFFWTLTRVASEPVADNAPIQAILILGSGSPNCQPSTTMESRLDEGLRQAARFPQARVLVTGGVGLGVDCSEASLMADYLIERGIPAQRLLREDRSASTDENLAFSQPILAAHGIDAAAPMILVTSDFHLLRALRIARKAGYAGIHGAAAPTPRYIRYNAWLREYFATLSSWALREF